MDTGSIIITLALAGGSLYFQWLTFRAATKDLTDFRANSERTMAEFRSEMTGIVSEIRGQTTTLETLLAQQFTQMLDAFVRGPERLSAAAGEAERSTEAFEGIVREIADVRERLGAVMAKVDGSGPAIEQLRAELQRDLQRVEREAQRGIEASAAARAAAQEGRRMRLPTSLVLSRIKRHFDDRGFTADAYAPLLGAVGSGRVIAVDSLLPGVAMAVADIPYLSIVSFEGTKYVVRSDWADDEVGRALTLAASP